MNYIQRFSEELISHSVSDDYDIAILEWIHNGVRWKENQTVFCICGHPILERCLVRNSLNQTELIIGNCCIHKFGIEREHWNKSRENYLNYTLSKARNYSEQKFIESLIDKLNTYPTLKMTDKQKKWIEDISGKHYRWNYSWEE